MIKVMDKKQDDWSNILPYFIIPPTDIRDDHLNMAAEPFPVATLSNYECEL